MNGMVIDCFAGGGGASQGIEEALGRPCDVAVNHDPKAIAMHKANHPATHHMTEDIWEADLEGYAAGRRVGLMWASPDCTHFSRAKGGKPRELGIRMLPWAVHRHAKVLLPDVIIMENVAEIQQWGPLGDDGRPVKAEEGKEYARFIDHMRDLGYAFECRELVAADYGAPTSRRRWYAVMRRDGRRIVWPARDHCPAGDSSGLAPYVPAASVIDWSLPCPSIFADRPSIKAAIGVNAVRPLADKTMRRIARGLDRYVVSCDDPFLVTGGGKALAGACLTEYFGNASDGLDARDPLRTITARDREGVTMAYLTAFYGGPHGGSLGQRPYDPLRTITTAAGAHFGIVSAGLGPCAPFLAEFYGGSVASGCNEPLHTVTASAGHFGVVRAELSRLPGRWPQVRTLLNEHCGYSLRDDEVLVTRVAGAPHFISDIGLRMLTPEELKLAQGFPSDYIIDRYCDGTPVTKAQQVKMIGNSVVPVMARKLVAANVA